MNIKKFIRPPYLKEGDTVAVITPASAYTGDYVSQGWREVIESWGLKVKLGKHLYDSIPGEFAGTDADRASDLEAALLDDDVKAIICYRGGYGTMRTIMNMDLNLFVQHPKWLVGFSDITVLHAALHRLGVESILGPMCFAYTNDPTGSYVNTRDALFGKVTECHSDPHPFSHCGQARGRLMGGNLALFNSTIGTVWENTVQEPSILFLEDIDERIHNIDRMLVTLRAGGILERAKAVIIGQFTDIQNEDKWKRTVYELIKEHTDTLDTPVLFGFPCGHEYPNLALYMGRELSLEVNSNGGTLKFL